jgi:F-type H+-transporting ATPase subunit b
MLTIDSTLFIEIASFLLLILILNIILFRPIRDILKKRKDVISSTEEMTQSLNRQASRHSEDLEANISETKKKGQKEKDSSKAAGREEELTLLKETHSMIEDRIKKTRKEIEEKSLKARDSLKAEVKEFSTDLAEKFLGRGI